ncbi:fungal specific transcription factor domain-containing protein [Gaeumannomyces tritici R3-111a-1]|uniref:Fungal specific transcription factor domain-containing protein n=1 Tax=Gaeumannomyces tritici (strain R3-111a-1) TaxID=644352 RepID=J3NPX6_GAET3|nr:fungal specific transcription factor domain-containing protein [Gaeumannomyces tritici R3-111a-1]EJT78232.1 fungal specific transcription factor domain-containing protein [Gaeumannomyces tritici R3-111a-1]
MASATNERSRPEHGSAQASPARSADAASGAPSLTSVPAGASVYNPSDTPDDSLNPRSCVTCRRRKVKCDKLQPCTNCRRAHIPCIFPAPGRAPRRPRPRDPNAPPTSKHHSSEREVELMKRLRKLEGIVEELSGQIEVEATRQGSSSESPEAATQDAPAAASAAGASQAGTSVDVGSSLRPLGRGPSISSDHGHEPPLSSPGSRCPLDDMHPGRRPLAQHGADPTFNRKFGRLVLHDKGRSRYVSSGFWSKINDEINELRTATEEWFSAESELSEEDTTPETSQGIPGGYSNSAFLFGNHTSDVDLRSFHPLPSQIPFIWQIYDQNVNSIIKILHSPTMAVTVSEACKRLDNLEPPLEALMFAIYMGAIVSMEEEEVATNFGFDQATLIAKYGYALEIALAKVEFLTSTDLTTFQAFVLYTTMVRRRNDTRCAWTLVGLVVRISHALGLHRDPTNFPGFSPFECEMRRRLFWYLLTMDFRAAEDQGTDLAIIDRSFDTQIPLNINDADFGPDSTELPPPRQGETEMTFLLMLYNIQVYLRRILNMTSAAGAACPVDINSPFEKREQLLEDIIKTVDRICPPSASAAKANPMIFLAATAGRVIHAKMTVVVYQSGLLGAYHGNPTGELTEERQERLYTAAIEVFEHGNLLALDPRVKQWNWMIRVFMQWQAAAYLLLRMSRAPWSPVSERAWTALSVTFSSASAAAELDRIADNAAVWLPFRRLYTRARRHRVAEVARLRADKAAARALDLSYMPKTAPSFDTLSNSVRAAMARQNWRKLVDAPPLEDGSPTQTQASNLQQGNREAARSASRPQPPGSRLPLTGPQLSASKPWHAQGVGGDIMSGAATAPDAFSLGVLDFVDQVMTQPTFAPADFWPLAFPPDQAPPDNSNLPPARTSNPFQQGTSAQRQSQPQPQPPASDAQLLDALRKNNAPPWLFPLPNGPSSSLTGSSRDVDEPNNTPYVSPSTAAALDGGDGPFADLPDIMSGITGDQLGSPSLEDLDVAMDTDDFNWQAFNENIRGFPSGAGSSATGLWGI